MTGVPEEVSGGEVALVPVLVTVLSMVGAESCGSVLACGAFLAVLLKTGSVACACMLPNDRVNTQGAKSAINKKEHRFIGIILFVSQVRGNLRSRVMRRYRFSFAGKPFCYFRIENYKIIITDKN
jgi:hypothetical protein